MYVPSMELTSDGKYSYLGRETTHELLKALLALNARQAKLILGNIGSGKSHILSTVVLQLMDRRIYPNIRVVYIADCERAVNAIYSELLYALQVAFPTNFNPSSFFLPSEKQMNYIRQFLKWRWLIKEKIYFIYDGWQYFDRNNLNAEDIQKKSFLLDITHSGIEVRTVSPPSPEYLDIHKSQSFIIPGRLSKEVWEG
jgi:predicted ATPase